MINKNTQMLKYKFLYCCFCFSSVEPFLTKVEILQKNLSTVNEVLNKWWFVQQKWIYLAEIYGSNEMLYIESGKVEQFNEINILYEEVVSC